MRRSCSSRSSRIACVEAQNAKTLGERLAAFKGFSPAELAPQPPRVSEPRTGLSMGQHAELMAQEWQIPRGEQDQLAYESHKKAAEAYRAGYMDDLVVPFAGVFRDNNLREDISLDKIATLKPAFDKSERGTLTAANSTPLTDGAAACCWPREEWAAKRGLPVQAYLTYAQTAANNFVDGEGLLMAPTIAVSRMLERARPETAGLRLLRDPRSVRRAGAVHAEGLGGPGLLQDVPRPRRSRWARSTAPS